jgi:uncharacterized protein (TIGR03118 family)
MKVYEVGSSCIRAGVLGLALVGCLAAADGYLVHNLVSDIPGLADKFDKNLVNPWGNGFSSGSPFWIGNNGTGTSTLYDGTGTATNLIVATPAPPSAGASATGAVTGVIFNTASSFFIVGTKGANFLFCTEDGTIEGWNAGSAATILVDNSASNANYKGCALGGTSTAPLLFAANFGSGNIDVFDGNLKPVTAAKAFVDPGIPSGFAPFNVAVLGGNVYVSYAKQDSDKHDDVAGPGNGYVSVFDQSGNMIAHLIAQGPLNSPWGMALAPSSFGNFGGALLVGNFGDGLINAFDPTSGKQLGTLADVEGGSVQIPGLWSLNVGNSKRSDSATLYFTAGIPGPFGDPVESHGLLGSIQPPPVLTAANIVNAAASTAALAPNTYVAITGGALSATSRVWNAGDFVANQLPAAVNGVSVTANGENAYVEFVSASQLSVLLPADLAPGPVKIQTFNNGLESSAVTITVQPVGPAFFMLAGNKYVAATHLDGSITGGTVTGVTTTPAKGGETIVLYGNGFGATQAAIPNGQLITSPLTLAPTPIVTIGGVQASVQFAGLVSAGLYQMNVVVPTGLPAGDNAIVAQVGGVSTQANAFVSISQ